MEEYEGMIHTLRYFFLELDSDKGVLVQIKTLEKVLELEIIRARMGYFYGSCPCGSICMSEEQLDTWIENASNVILEGKIVYYYMCVIYDLNFEILCISLTVKL